MILTFLFSLIRSFVLKKSLNITKVLLFTVTLYLSISHLKHQPFFVIASSVFLYDDFYLMLGTCYKFISGIIPNMPDKNKLLFVKETTAYIIVLFITAIMLIPGKYPLSITHSDYPYSLIEFIKINNFKGKLLINFQWGSYAEYKLFPNCKVGLDGRYEEVFDTNLFFALNNFNNAKAEYWTDLIDIYPPDIIIIEKKFPAFNKLLEMNNWHMVFEDKATGLFVSDKLKKENYIIPSFDNDYYEKTKFDKNFSFIKRKF